MTLDNWVDWCKKQLGDLSLRLFRQGYHPVKIEELNQTSPEFRKCYGQFLDRLNRVMAEMAANPEGYHHFEEFAQTKKSLLEYTNLHRERFLSPGLAKTA